MPATFLERYQAGDHAAVWDDLMALGPAVRHELYLADATAVAAETMKRARHNVELIIQRLKAMDYRFLTLEASEALQDAGLHRLRHTAGATAKRFEAGDPEVAAQARDRAVQHLAESFDKDAPPHTPAPKSTAGDLKRLEKLARGPFPLSLRAWYEQVGGVSLLGWHSTIHPNPDEPAASMYPPDPLMIAPLDEIMEMVEQEGEGGEIALWLSPDDLTKAHTSGGDPYSITIPNACADAIFDDGNGETFVHYLRQVFLWGGFPGWRCAPNPPREEIAKLTEGLLPI